MRGFIPVIFAIAILAALYLPSASAVEQGAAPVWEKGDDWAMGYEMDIGATLDPLLDAYGVMNEDFDSFDSDLQGKMGYYVAFEIVEETDSSYTMDITSGGGIDMDASVKIATEMPVEGIYTDQEPPMQSKEISIDLVLDISQDLTGKAHFTKDGLKLKDLQMEMSVEASVDLAIENFPDTSYDYDDISDKGTTTVKYADYDISGSADVTLSVNMEFNPPLDLFSFPIEEDEEWLAESNATISGTYQGTVDVKGLPQEVMEGMIEENLAFPLVLENIDTGIDEIENGVIKQQTVPVMVPMSCTGTEMVTLEDGSSSDSLVIQFSGEDYEDYGGEDYGGLPDIPLMEEVSGSEKASDMKFLYCPEEGFFVSAHVEDVGEGLGVEGMGSLDSFKLTPMSNEEAQKNMGSFGEDSDKGSNLLIPILIGVTILSILAVLGLIVLIFVVVLAVVLKKKKS